MYFSLVSSQIFVKCKTGIAKITFELQFFVECQDMIFLSFNLYKAGWTAIAMKHFLGLINLFVIFMYSVYSPNMVIKSFFPANFAAQISHVNGIFPSYMSS